MSGARSVLERVPQLGPGGDAELREEPVQVRLHRSVREIEALADLPIREALCGELGDLKLLRREPRPAAGNAAPNGLTGGTQLPAGPLGVPEQAEGVKRLGGLPERRPRLRHAPMPPQP